MGVGGFWRERKRNVVCMYANTQRFSIVKSYTRRPPPLNRVSGPGLDGPSYNNYLIAVSV